MREAADPNLLTFCTRWYDRSSGVLCWALVDPLIQF